MWEEDVSRHIPGSTEVQQLHPNSCLWGITLSLWKQSEQGTGFQERMVI